MTKGQLIAALAAYPDETPIYVYDEFRLDLEPAAVRVTRATPGPMGGDCRGRYMELQFGTALPWKRVIVLVGEVK